MRLQLKRGATSQARDPYRLDSLRSKSPRFRYYRRSPTAWYNKSRCLPERRRHQCTMHSECCEKQDQSLSQRWIPHHCQQRPSRERNIIRSLQKNSDIAYPPGKHWYRVCCKLNIYLTGIFLVLSNLAEGSSTYRLMFSLQFCPPRPNIRDFFWLPPLSRWFRALVDKKRTHEVCR